VNEQTRQFAVVV